MESWTLEQARALLWNAFRPGSTELREIPAALGLVLAEDLVSDLSFPPFDRIAMDGYAVRAADTLAASAESPVRLEVVGSAEAGRGFAGDVEAGQATKAMTGAPLPPGADAVVPIESTAGWSNATASIHAPVHAGDHVAPKGQDLSAGSIVLARGTRLAAHHVQALLSAGHPRVPIVAPPRVAILATGDEFVAPDQTPGQGQIRESNSGCGAAVFAQWCVPCELLGVLGDDLDATRVRLEAALRAYEIVVLTGGVSKGQLDHVKPALRACGVTLEFESLQLKPGHPTTYGRHAGGHVFALPGNPVAVFVTLTRVFGAGIRRRLGYLDPESPASFARAGEPLVRRGSRPQFVPVRLEGFAGDLPTIHSTGHHGSGDFISLARADALAWLPVDAARYEVGQVVRVYPFTDAL